MTLQSNNLMQSHIVILGVPSSTSSLLYEPSRSKNDRIPNEPSRSKNDRILTRSKNDRILTRSKNDRILKPVSPSQYDHDHSLTERVKELANFDKYVIPILSYGWQEVNIGLKIFKNNNEVSANAKKYITFLLSPEKHLYALINVYRAKGELPKLSSGNFLKKEVVDGQVINLFNTHSACYNPELQWLIDSTLKQKIFLQVIQEGYPERKVTKVISEILSAAFPYKVFKLHPDKVGTIMYMHNNVLPTATQKERSQPAATNFEPNLTDPSLNRIGNEDFASRKLSSDLFPEKEDQLDSPQSEISNPNDNDKLEPLFGLEDNKSFEMIF